MHKVNVDETAPSIILRHRLVAIGLPFWAIFERDEK